MLRSMRHRGDWNASRPSAPGEAPRARDDSGNLIAVLILIVVLSLLIVVTVAAVIPSFGTASTSQYGEQAVAQANAGVSDALFRLDQINGAPSNFCVGTPPASLLPSGLTAASCSPGGALPLPSAPGLVYYVVQNVSGTPPAGVTNEMTITSSALVLGQHRTVTTTTYRVANQFALFGVSGLNTHGSLSGSSVYEVGGNPPVVIQGTVDVGVGPSGAAVCTGNSAGSNIVTIGEANATIASACPNGTSETTSFEPKLPVSCGAGQVVSSFAPCLNTTAANFATSSGSTYCPLPGTGIPNTLSTTTALATPPGSGAVFNCTSSGGTLKIDTGSAFPFTLSKIPPGSYYFDSNNVTLGNIDSADFTGPVSLFILPQACGTTVAGSGVPPSPNNCAMSIPTAPSAGCSPPASMGAASLTLGSGDFINAESASVSPFGFTPGNSQNLSVYWSGNAAVTGTKSTFDGTLYAPGANLTGNGHTALQLFGSSVLNCFDQNGGPQMYLVYPQHSTNFLQGWTTANYSITP